MMSTTTWWQARFGVLSDRDFRLYWLARTLSLIGDYAFRTAFATYIISVSGSASVLAVATAVLLVPSLMFFLIGGAVGDRAGSRRRIMVIADIGRFLTLVLIALAVATTDNVPILVLLAVLIGVGDGFFLPVSFAYLAEITPRERLVPANSALSISQQVGLIGGPLLGGVLVGLAGATWAFAFDGLTFALSAGLLLAIRATSVPNEAQAVEITDEPAPGVADRLRQLGSDIGDAVRYVRGVHWLLIAIAVGAFTNAMFAGVLDVAVPLLMAPAGTHDAPSLGAFYAVQGIGALVGAAVLTKVKVHRIGITLYLMLSLMALSLTAAGVIGGGPGTVAVALAYGFGLHFFNSLFPSVMQDQVDQSMLSRVGSLAYLGFFGLMPLGALVMGPLAAWLGASGTAIFAGLVACGVSLAALTAPSVRGMTDQPVGDTADEPVTA